MKEPKAKEEKEGKKSKKKKKKTKHAPAGNRTRLHLS
jgi:hypothetical protein